MCLSPSSGRFWDCMRSVLSRQDSVAELGAVVMQQADVAALWLLDALVLTLPQSLLQAYIMVSTDVGIISPGWITLFVLWNFTYLIRIWVFCLPFIPSVLTLSGLFLWSVCAVYFLGPGAVQQSLLSDTTGSPSHASSSSALPACVEGRHAGCKGDLPHVLCQGL